MTSEGANLALIVGLGMNVLAAPKDVTGATALACFTLPASSQWRFFLDELSRGFLATMQTAEQPRLDALTCEELKIALGNRPGAGQAILEVSPDGQLHTASGTIAWDSI